MASTNFKVKNGLEITSGTLVVSNGAGTNGQVLQSTGTGVEWGTASSGSGTVTSITAGTGLSGGVITTSGTIAIDSTVATLTGTQTLTNKTLTSPTLTTPALGTPASGTLTNCTFPTLNQNTTGSAGSVANTLTITSPLSGTSYNGSAAVSIGIPAATTSVSGYLSSADWNTFNNKGSGTVTSVTGTSPVASSGGTTPAISLNSGYGDTQNPYASKTANYVLAAPNGSAGVPTFRAIVAADIPTLNQNTTGSSGSCTGNSATATSATTATTATTATNLSGGSVAATTGTFSGTVTIKSGSPLGKLTVQTGGSDPVSPAAGDMVWYY